MKLSKKYRSINPEDRKINLLPTNMYETVLVIINKAEQIQHNLLHQAFPAASFSFLSMRNEKQDRSSGSNYTLHKSDIRFGRIKNDRLKTLVNTNFDLLIDLSEHSKLNDFSQVLNANLKAGCFDKQQNNNLDILVKYSLTLKDVVKDIAQQIDKLTLNKKK